MLFSSRELNQPSDSNDSGRRWHAVRGSYRTGMRGVRRTQLAEPGSEPTDRDATVISSGRFLDELLAVSRKLQRSVIVRHGHASPLRKVSACSSENSK